MAILVTRYYRAAVADDGARGCALLYSIFAEEVQEVYGKGAGPPGLRGNTCAQVMSKAFAHHHRELLRELPRLRVIHVRVKRLRGDVLLSFGKGPQRQLAIHLEHGVWKIDEMLDRELG